MVPASITHSAYVDPEFGLILPMSEIGNWESVGSRLCITVSHHITSHHELLSISVPCPLFGCTSCCSATTATSMLPLTLGKHGRSCAHEQRCDRLRCPPMPLLPACVQGEQCMTVQLLQQDHASLFGLVLPKCERASWTVESSDSADIGASYRRRILYAS